MNDAQFLDVLKISFKKYLETGGRSNKKLIILHGAVSADLDERLAVNNDVGGVFSVASLGYEEGREMLVEGRYMDKKVDITICWNGSPVAGIGVKYVMSNYRQNSNNYFENMLGETANIRCNQIPYFQIFVVPDIVPYFEKDGRIKVWESISSHHLKKYIALSEDSIDLNMHTPNKTLVYMVHISGSENLRYQDRNGYRRFYQENDFTLTLSPKRFRFSEGVIYNDYEGFIRRVVHTVLSL